MPRAEADLPSFDSESLAVTYDYFHGYRHLARAETAPEYPFGFGLGYTTFSATDLGLESTTVALDGVVEATVRIDNTGSSAGRHTVQLYVAAVSSAVVRAPEDLRAFQQVELAAGASDTVTLSFPVEDVAFWDVSSGSFLVEPIEYEVRVGAHAGDPLALTARFTVSP
jgi:beta-glucosidase